MSENARAHRRPRPRTIALMLAPLAIAAAILAATASAGGTPTVKSAHSSQLDKTIVVNPSGFTLYVLSPETARHLLCTSRECLQAWPPLTVRSRGVKLEDGAGVHGALGLLERPGGQLQVTLRGMPLYRFAGDSAAHEVNGEGIRSFGGTWHAAGAAASEVRNTSGSSSAPAGGSGW
jgi:predicted lipoprotein with Yx(FWY)xxD motif